MQVWAVIYTPASFSDDLYQKGLSSVDEESQVRIRKYYHREDSCRVSKGTLIGRLLVRSMLKKRGISPTQMKFGATMEGKPYIMTQTSVPPIAYNITHDNNLVAMAVAPGMKNPPAFSVGIDVMKIRIPGRDTLRSFINSVGDQLTPLEHYLLKSATSETEQLEIFFWMWTLKEAYTKALGLGLGFDFKRIEFDVTNRIVRVDRQVPQGWKFNMFVINDKDDLYQGVVAEYVGEVSTTVEMEVNPDWLKTYDAVSFTTDAVNILKA